MSPERRESNASNKQAGQGFVEFALILPVLLLLMWGVIEFGRLLFIYTEVSNAAREAVRFGVVYGEGGERNYELCGGKSSVDCDICEAGNGATVLTDLDESRFHITYDDGGGGNVRVCTEGKIVPDPGDRLVVAVTYPVQPLVLFQNAGPFQVQFTAARTLVHEGIAMSGFGDVPAGNPHLEVPEGFGFVPDEEYPAGCCGRFNWEPLKIPVSYALFQWFPEAKPVITQTNVLWHPLEGLDCMPVLHSDIYYVQAYTDTWDPSGRSNYAVIDCLSQPENFRYEPLLSCDGAFKWTEGEHIDGYHLYTPDVITVPIGCPAGKCSYAMDLTSTGPFTLTAYNSLGDGTPSSIMVYGCTNPLMPPTLTGEAGDPLTPCTGLFKWVEHEDAEDALGYHFYEASAGLISGDLPTTTLEYGELTVNNGEQYQVVPYNTAGESGPSNVVTVDWCGPVDMTYYLHTKWPGGVCMDHTEPVTLTMNEDPQTCRQYVHDYNDDGVDPKGREVREDESLVWHSSPSAGQRLTITGTVTLQLWYQNPGDSNIAGSVYLCTYHGDSGYDCPNGAHSFTLIKKTSDWTEVTLPLGGVSNVEVVERLVVSVTHSSSDSAWFIYDKGQWFLGDGYQSRIEFLGQWGAP